MGARFLSRVRQQRIIMLLVLFWRLRIVNIIRVLLHRNRCRSGFYEKKLTSTGLVDSNVFWCHWSWRYWSATNPTLRKAILERADEIVDGNFRRFEDEKIFEGKEPVWHKGVYCAGKHLHFSKVVVNAIPGEDVKLCWDLSRFKWLSQLVVASVNAESAEDAGRYIDRAHQLIKSWLSSNKYFCGVNWACAQEVSIRGLHLINALLMLEKHAGAAPADAAIEFLHASYRRVKATIGYSLSQENNHSLTESLFLCCALKYLSRSGRKICSAYSAAQHKRRARSVFMRLVQADGSFRMYSINYHRAVCDIVSLCKVISDALGDDLWDAPMLDRVKKMHEFSQAVTLDNGSVSNIGHNDGSLHALQYAPYNNYAPSIILMGMVFNFSVDLRFSVHQNSIYGFNKDACFVNVERPLLQHFDDFGLSVIRFPYYQAFVKYARNSGRPQQEDFLHLDLWVQGQNVFHDSGTYSYNPRDSIPVDYFDVAAAHNSPYIKDGTIASKLGRFLYLDWPCVLMQSHAGESVCLDLSLRTAKGIIFHRTMSFSDRIIHIVDHADEFVSWGVAFNTPLQLPAGPQNDPIHLGNGVVFESDNRVTIEPARYSRRYLDELNGSRLLVDGVENKVVCMIKLEEV